MHHLILDLYDRDKLILFNFESKNSFRLLAYSRIRNIDNDLHKTDNNINIYININARKCHLSFYITLCMLKPFLKLKI